jgi:predicted DsbA family dithiol-disulfide isomerase
VIPATPAIEVFADVGCPFTHVGLRRLVERRDELGRGDVVRVKAWPLELVNGEPLDAALVAEEVAELRAQVAPDLFKGFDPTRFPATSLPAFAVAAAAYRESPRLGERVSLALRHALFEEGRDIAEPSVLAEIASAHGLAPGTADEAAVLDDWREGQRRGVLGSPHFFAHGIDVFCPSLEITRVGGHLQITGDPNALEDFLRRALG